MFLVSDARRFGAPDLEAYFRRRTVLAAGALVVVAAVGLLVFRFDARHVFDGLFAGWGLAFLLARGRRDGRDGAGWCRRGNHLGTRLAAIAAVASWCWPGAWPSGRTCCRPR